PSGHIGHNKFVVFVDAGGVPRAVLTGSTNWTFTALCGQANNALVVENDALAAAYLDYWKRLKADTDAAAGDPKKLQSAGFRTANQTPHDIPLEDGASLRLWFSPNTRQREKSANSPAPADLSDVFDRIAAAKQAILFLAFQPGTPSIVDAIAKAS